MTSTDMERAALTRPLAVANILSLRDQIQTRRLVLTHFQTKLY